MSDWAGLFFDLVMLAALGVTIRYARHLSVYFEKMQEDRKAFEQMIAALNIASARAESAVKNLKEAAGSGGDAVQEKINKARELAGELEIMIEAGDSLATRLENAATGKTKAAAVETTETPTRMSRAEKELMDALKTRQNT